MHYSTEQVFIHLAHTSTCLHIYRILQLCACFSSLILPFRLFFFPSPQISKCVGCANQTATSHHSASDYLVTTAAIYFSPARLRPPACANSHVQALLSFGSLVLGAVAHDSVAVRQVEVECDQRAVLQAQGPQCGAVNLEGEGGNRRQEDSRGDPLGKLLTENAFEIQLEHVSGYCTSIQKYSCTLFSSSAVLNNNAASLYMRTNHGGNVVFESMQAPEV